MARGRFLSVSQWGGKFCVRKPAEHSAGAGWSQDCPNDLGLSWHFYASDWSVFAHNSVSLLLFLQKSRSNLGNYPEHYVCTQERWIHDPSCGGLQYVFALCKTLRGGVHLQVVSSIREQICQESGYFIYLKIGTYHIIWFPKWFLCSQAKLVLLKGPGPLAAGTAVCLLVCLTAFWSPPHSFNSTFLCSMKALHSKDLTTQEWVLLSFLSSFFSPLPLCSLHRQFLLSAARPEAPLFCQ